MNRVLCFLGSRDPQQQAVALHRRARFLGNQIEVATGHLVEVWIPSSAEIADEGQTEDTLQIAPVINLKPQSVSFENAVLEVANQLQRASEELAQAASKLFVLAEGGDA